MFGLLKIRLLLGGKGAPAATALGLDAPAATALGLDAPAATAFGLGAPAATALGLGALARTPTATIFNTFFSIIFSSERHSRQTTL